MKHHFSAFSLLESLVAMFVLLICIAVFGMILSFSSSLLTRNSFRMTGVYLAQECLELVRNHRDSAWKQNQSAFCAFDDISASYRVSRSFAPFDSISCRSGWGVSLEKNPASFQLFLKNGWFVHDDSGVATPFSRTISLENLSHANAFEKVLVRCEVSWKERSEKESVSLSFLLTDWKK